MHVPPTCDLSDELCDSEMLGAGGPSGFLGQILASCSSIWFA